MAIAYDNSTAGTANDGTSVSYTCASGAKMFLAFNGNVTGITYNGTALTLVRSFTSPITDGNEYTVTIYKLDNPASGTHNLVFSLSSGNACYSVVTYTGAYQIENFSDEYSHTNGPPPANTQVSTWTGSVTTLTNNSWAVMFIVGGNNAPRAFTASTGTIRGTTGSGSTNSIGIIDSNGVISPAGSTSLVADWASGSGFVVSTTVSLRLISVPDAPTIGTATQVGGAVSVTFSDNDNGGSAITGHTVTATPGGATGTGSSPVVITGLNGGISYTFKVKATNAIGDSAESSASNAVTINTGLLAFFP